jgi:acetyl-CoA synthetase (ADP-forming)
MTTVPAVATLSEAESKRLMAEVGIPIAAEELVADPTAAVAASRRLGYPVVVKLCGPGVAHKTERGLVRLGLADDAAVTAAATELLAAAGPADGEAGLLVAQMVSGWRELIAGVVRDPQFGPCVMLGVGGVLAEALADVVFRAAPLSRTDAEEMIEDLGAQALLGELRGEPPVARDQLTDVLVGLGALATRPGIVSVDVNPLIVSGGAPVAVDALVEVDR